MTFILTWADDQINIYGPFNTVGDAVKWGEDWQERSGDDPSWNTITLPADTKRLAIEIRSPQ